MSGLHARTGPSGSGLFILELVLAQGDVEPAGSGMLGPEAISVKSFRVAGFKPRAALGVWGLSSHRG